MTPALEHCRVLREIYVAGIAHWSTEQLAALDAAQASLMAQDDLQTELEQLKQLVGQQSTLPPAGELQSLKDRVNLAMSILGYRCR